MGTTDDFLAFSRNKVVRLWKYKRMFTPFEQDKRFPDQSEFVDDICEKVVISDVYDVCGAPLVDYCPLDWVEISPDNGDFVASAHFFARLQDVDLQIMDSDTDKFKKGVCDPWA